jgi:protein-S-isoprenylcysteine O-methyltransferase Ste14
MKSKFIEWYKKKYSKRQKIVYLMLQAPFFIFILPLSLLFLSIKIDGFFGLSEFLPVPLNFYLGIPFLIAGFYLSSWTIAVQFRIGEGTPLPMMPTQKLVVLAPYTYCRNPMGLGYGIALWGFGIFFNSLAYLGISTIFIVLLLLYYKFIEEKELEARFGQEYVDYKRRVPFLIPRFRKK